jgi:chromosome segregation ATPase
MYEKGSQKLEAKAAHVEFRDSQEPINLFQMEENTEERGSQAKKKETLEARRTASINASLSLVADMVRLQTLEKENDELRHDIINLRFYMTKYKDENQTLSKDLEIARQTHLDLLQQHQREADGLQAEKDRRIGLLEQGIENRKIQFQQLIQLIRHKDEKLKVLTEKYLDQLQLRQSESDERRAEQRLLSATKSECDLKNTTILKLELEVQQLADANKRGEQQIDELRGDVKRLAGLNREKDTTIKDLEVNLKTRTEERDQARAQYEFVQQQFLECCEWMENSGDSKVKVEKGLEEEGGL